MKLRPNLGLVLCLISSPVHGQAWIGEYVGRMLAQQAQHQCMMGVPKSVEQIADARMAAKRVMAAYWQTFSGGKPASLFPFFHDSRKSVWRADGVDYPVKALGDISDPLSVAGTTLSPSPESFIRAGQGGSARGVWRVTGSDGLPIGAYLADFTRRAGRWKLQALTIYGLDEQPPTSAQFCATPGDVEAYRARMTEIERRRLEKREEKRRKGAMRFPAFRSGPLSVSVLADTGARGGCQA